MKTQEHIKTESAQRAFIVHLLPSRESLPNEQGAYRKVSSSSLFPPSEAGKKSPNGQSGKAERIFQQTPPREEGLPLEILPKDKNIIAVCQGISFITIHSWYHLSIGRGIVASLSMYKSAAVRLSLCSLCSFDRYFVMFFLSLSCC